MAPFAAAWIAQLFDAQVVVMIRHPAAFASSLKKLDWQFSFKPWLDQPSLMADLLEPYRAEIQDHYEREVDVVDQAILMWKAMHDVIDGYRKRHPEWRFVRHEDLSAEPIEGFRALYHHLGLTWGERVERGLARYSSAGNPDEVPAWRHRSVRRDSAAARRTWLRRLTPDEIARVRAGVAGVSERFYGDDDWGA